MKSLITFLFIIVASTTYRCGKEEETIDCNEATSQMVGTWNGNLLYTLPGPQNANTANIIPGATGVNHDFVLEEPQIFHMISHDITYVGVVERLAVLGLTHTLRSSY